MTEYRVRVACSDRNARIAAVDAPKRCGLDAMITADMGAVRGDLSPRPAMSSFQVLVASSDIARRDVLAGLLVQCGMRPLITTNASGIRSVFNRGPVHLVFCEDDLPEGGFHEVLRLVSATRSEVPLVVCSRLGELDEYLEAMRVGAFDFIAPPYHRAEIESIVNRVRQDYVRKPAGQTLVPDKPLHPDIRSTA